MKRKTPTKKKMAEITIKSFGWKRALSTGLIRIGGRGTTAKAVITRKGEKKFRR